LSSPWWNDDDRLLAVLGDAIRPLPRRVVESANGAYTWRHIDAELADLTYDSVLQEELVPATRTELASVRRLTFETPSRDVTIELEVTPGGLIGQLWPPWAGALEVHMVDGKILTADVDEVGGFVVRPTPSCSFRLSCLTAEHATVVTTWTTL
jgi:hypothetical protein